MAKVEQNSLTTASVLAFERKLDPSDALFYAARWEDRNDDSAWLPVGVREKSVRGTISNRQKTKGKEIDPAKLDAAIENPNLQTVDVATLPSNADTLKVRFTLRVLGGAGTPSACNNAAYQAKLASLVQSYVAANGYHELAKRYAHNLANGRFLWRNRVGAESVEVRVAHVQDGEASKTWAFDALAFHLRKFEAPPAHSAALAELASVIEGGLAGKGYVLLDVAAYARMGDGQETFPSQELILDKGTEGKSKTLYTVAGVAAIHSQKLGNAIRSIDDWYSFADEELGPIAVEPYGSVTSRGKAYRQPREKRDFYSLLDAWTMKDEAPQNIGDQHYVMATLIRGGVFGESGKD